MEIFELAVVRRLTRPAGDELMDENGGGPLARQIDVPTTQGRPTLSNLAVGVWPEARFGFRPSYLDQSATVLSAPACERRI